MFPCPWAKVACEGADQSAARALLKSRRSNAICLKVLCSAFDCVHLSLVLLIMPFNSADKTG
jgi:hypothetical protein